MRIKRLYIICLKIDAFLCGIRAIGLCFSINIKLENLAVKRISLFLALESLCKSLKNYLISATPSMQSLFRVKLAFISYTKIILK
jgi:hypothetical protein